MKRPLLEVRQISKKIDGRYILDQVSLEILEGQVTGLLGPNGAGKTTAFYTITGLYKPDKGDILLLGEKVTSLPAHKRAERGLGFLAQEPSIFRDMTVEENILAVLEIQGHSRKEQKSRMEEALEKLRLSTLRYKKAQLLSGGERRRLEIARALANRPKIILMDEPFANVDPITIQDVQEMVLELKAQGIGILITDHNAREIFEIANYCFLMSCGQVLAQGTPQDLMASAIVKERYLGESFSM
jgi:lipopolysaccharide export system ATP-binding protein